MNARTLIRALPACLATLLFLSACAVPTDHTESEQRSFTPLSDLLTITVDRGDLEVSPGNVKEIRVERWVSGRSPLGRPSASWELNGEILSLSFRCDRAASCHIRHKVIVPKAISLTVQSVDGHTEAKAFSRPLSISTTEGSVSVSRISGPLILNSVHGDIHGRGLRSNDFRASTRSGTIDVSFAEPPDEARVNTQSGLATLELPEEVYDVYSSQNKGRVVTEVDTDDDSPYEISAQTDGGRIRVVSPE